MRVRKVRVTIDGKSVEFVGAENAENPLRPLEEAREFLKTAHAEAARDLDAERRARALTEPTPIDTRQRASRRVVKPEPVSVQGTDPLAGA